MLCGSSRSCSGGAPSTFDSGLQARAVDGMLLAYHYVMEKAKVGSAGTPGAPSDTESDLSTGTK